MSFSRRSSQGPSSVLSGDEDLRFSELLKPIKDLTENWQIPIAQYLDEYYRGLNDVHISLDGQTAKVRQNYLTSNCERHQEQNLFH